MAGSKPAGTPITRKNVPNVGSAVELGELYDATRDVLMINNLFTRETIEEKSTNLTSKSAIYLRDVSAGATGATEVAPKFSDTLTLSQPGGADFAHRRRGRT